MAEYEGWIGKVSEAGETAERWPLAGLTAALDHVAPGDGDEILPLAHWLYFPPMVRQSRIGSDGHPQRGDFLPPFPQPRRMWAGSDIRFLRPIRLGDRMQKTARIASIAEKAGKSGPLIFLSVENSIRVDGADALTETQTLVYRDDPAPGEAPPPAKPAPDSAAWSEEIRPDPVLLFRYSAVTFNAHRIHYDETYARDVEGYPGIIVHGQLTATLMLQACLRANPGFRPTSFSFRAVRPLFSGAPFFVEGAPDAEEGAFKLWARSSDGALSMSGDVRLATP